MEQHMIHAGRFVMKEWHFLSFKVIRTVKHWLHRNHNSEGDSGQSRKNADIDSNKYLWYIKFSPPSVDEQFRRQFFEGDI